VTSPARQHTYTTPHYRLSLVRDRTVRYQAPSLCCADTAALALAALLGDAPGERLVVAYLDNHLRVMGTETIAMGGQTGCGGSLPELFRGAVLIGARAVILAHNHPSGSSEPSDRDAAMTAAAVQAGQLLGIEVLDHFVVGDSDAYGIVSKTVVKLPRQQQPPPTEGTPNA